MSAETGKLSRRWRNVNRRCAVHAATVYALATLGCGEPPEHALDERSDRRQAAVVEVEAAVWAFHAADTARNAEGVIELLWPEFTMLADGTRLSYVDVATGSREFMGSLESFHTEWSDLEIVPLGVDAAVSSFTFRDSIVTRAGELIRSRGPTTLVWQRRGGEWKVLFGDADHYPLDLAHPPANYIYFGLERARITESQFLLNSGVIGAQLKYTWKELEPERDQYAFDALRSDLEYLERHGKRLFIQLQDVSFDTARVNVPSYLVEVPEFGGGVAMHYDSHDDSDPTAEGWVARRWDSAVRERFARLFEALAAEFDGRIAGLNLPETSIGFGGRVELEPAGYSDAVYFEGIKELMSSAREAFHESDVIIYANFMRGEELPDVDRGYLKGVYEHADRIGMGVGGPDLLPHRWFQRQNSLPLIAQRAPGTVAGVAVQWGNLEDTNRQTGEQVTVEELYEYARDELRLDYIFWGTQAPFYSNDILPFLQRLD